MDLLDEEDIDAMRRIAEKIRDRNSMTNYGYFPGGDPREFFPDPECCSDAERANHERACKLMEEGAIAGVDGRHHFPIERDGEVIGHVTHAAFGIGTYTVSDGDIDDLANQLDALIDAIRKAEERYK